MPGAPQNARPDDSAVMMAGSPNSSPLFRAGFGVLQGRTGTRSPSVAHVIGPAKEALIDRTTASR